MGKKLNYTVIFESNIIFGRPINREVIVFIKNCKANKKINTKFYVPEVVVDESKKHLLDDFLKVKEKYNAADRDLCEILPRRKLQNIRAREQEIFQIADKAFSENKINVLQTPVGIINWAQIIKKAVYKKPPFDPRDNTEKGFKDAVISETVLSNISNLSKISNIIFLCNDNLLVEYLKTKTKKYKNFKIFPSIPDFESSLRLHLLEVDDKLIEEVTREAEDVFYKALDASSLFYREDVPKQMQENYPTLFADPKIEGNLYYGVAVWNNVEISWVPISEPEYRVSKPVFIKKEDGLYYWESIVIYKQIFENEPTRTSLQYQSFDNRGEHILEFKVTWKSPVTKNGKVEVADSKVLKIEYVPRPRSPSFTVIGPTMLGNATIAGQGTSPVIYNPSFSDVMSDTKEK